MRTIEEMNKSIKNVYKEINITGDDIPNKLEELLNHYFHTHNFLHLRDTHAIDDVTDPNLQEFVEVARDARVYLYEQRASEENLEKTREKIELLRAIVLHRLVSNGLARENDALYNLINNAGDMIFCGTKEELIDSFVDQKLAGVGEFLAKLKRHYSGKPMSADFLRYSDVYSYKYLNHEEFRSIVTLMGLLSDVDDNRIKVFEAIKKWHDQPIYYNNVTDYSFALENDKSEFEAIEVEKEPPKTNGSSLLKNK